MPAKTQIFGYFTIMNEKNDKLIDTDNKDNIDKAAPSIEERLEKIEQLLEQMESEDTGLEETFKLYEQGLKLIKDTEASIDKVEKQIKILSEDE